MPDEDLAEELLGSDRLRSEERDPEAPAEDAMEQAIPVKPTERPVEVHRGEVHRGLEVSEYDAVEQARVVELDEDEYY
jgi:hypothetical protein